MYFGRDYVMKTSLMTLNMMGAGFRRFQINHDKEEFEDLYEEVLDLAVSTGYSAVDISSAEVGFLGKEYVLEQFQKRGLCAGSYILFDQFAGPDETGSYVTERGFKAVEAAKEFGTDVIMLVPLAFPGIEKVSPEEIRRTIACHMEPVALFAGQHGLHAVVEDTPDLRVHLDTAAELQDLFSMAPDMELVYDSGNMLLVHEDPVAYYEKFADRTSHVHLKDMRKAVKNDMVYDTGIDGERLTAAAIGTGLVDLRAVLKSLRVHGYDGVITVEFAMDDSGDYEAAIIRSREYLEKAWSES